MWLSVVVNLEEADLLHNYKKQRIDCMKASILT